MSDPTTVVAETTTIETAPSEPNIDASAFKQLPAKELAKLIKQVEVAAQLRWDQEVAEGLISVCHEVAKAFGENDPTDRNRLNWELDEIKMEAYTNTAKVIVTYQGQEVLANRHRNDRVFLPGAWMDKIRDQHAAALEQLEGERQKRQAQYHASQVQQLIAVMQTHGYTDIPSLPKPKFAEGTWVKVIGDDSYCDGEVGTVISYDPLQDRFEVNLVESGSYNLYTHNLEATTAPTAEDTSNVDATAGKQRYELYCKLFREKPVLAAFIAKALLAVSYSNRYRETTALMVEVLNDPQADVHHRQVAAQTLTHLSNPTAVSALIDAVCAEESSLNEIAIAALADWEKRDELVY